MITVMKNSKSKSSVTKQSNMNKEKKQQQKNNSPRSALKLKDLNVSSFETPRGCLSFFLSDHHKNVCNQSKSGIANTPRTVKPARRKLGGADMENPGKPTSTIVSKLSKNSNFSSRSDLCDGISSGSELKLCDIGGSLTPVSKFGNGSGSDSCVRLGDENRICGANTSPVPPVEVSVSPEIQGGSASVVPATPNTCYGAGHVLSGVSDRRKCKPKGILTIGNNDLFGSSKTNVDETVTVTVTVCLNKRKVSLVPSPADASVHWILSPCDEDKSEGQEEENGSGLRLSRFVSSGCLSSSPCSSLGFSSEMLNKSYSTSSSSESSRSRGLLGPSFDHFVCSPTPSSSPVSTSWKLGISHEEGLNLCGQGRESTPYSEGSVGSGNVVRTPQSNSSSPMFGLPCMIRDEISRLWFDNELGSVSNSQNPTADDSPKTSFEFNPLIKPISSFDFSPFRNAIDSQISTEIPDSLLTESEARISWREGLASYLFEIDELDCCRCFSDDEDNDNGSNPDRIAVNSCDNIDINDEGYLTTKGIDPCQESTSERSRKISCFKDDDFHRQI